MNLMNVFDDYFEQSIVIQWANGLKVKGVSSTGSGETSREPEDEDYDGGYWAGMDDVEILEKGQGDSIETYSNNTMAISLLNLPEKVMLEDGTVLWQRHNV